MERHRLERRPEARAFSVEMLLQLVRDGKLRIPDFQRPLRWRASHVIDLFDSVYRGFPVGDLLLFKRSAESAPLRLGPVDIRAPAVADAYFVVDGQQRIVALAGAMLHPEPRPAGDLYAVWFDLQQERFVLLPPRGVEPPPTWIPLNAVGDSFVLLNWLNAWPFRGQRPDLVQNAIALGKALREYQIPAYIVESTSDDVLRLIFKRVNTSGVRMQESEVFEALFSGKEPHAIESARARLQTATGFGEIDRAWVLKCVKVNDGLDVRRALAEGDPGMLDPMAVERAESALLQAIRFLSVDAGIPHIRLLPYPLPLVVLARFFSLHPRATPRSRALLVRWVWRGALSAAHSDSTDGAVRRSAALIDDDEAASVERLLASVATDFETPRASLAWSSNETSQTRLCALAILHLGPRDLATGEALSVEQIQDRLDGGLGPTFVDVTGTKRSTTVAGRVVLSTPADVPKLCSAPLRVLQSHGIDAAAADALRRRDSSTFLRRRAEILDRWFDGFFAGKTAADDLDRPAISELKRRVSSATPPT